MFFFLILGYFANAVLGSFIFSVVTEPEDATTVDPAATTIDPAATTVDPAATTSVTNNSKAHVEPQNSHHAEIQNAQQKKNKQTILF